MLLGRSLINKAAMDIGLSRNAIRVRLPEAINRSSHVISSFDCEENVVHRVGNYYSLLNATPTRFGSKQPEDLTQNSHKVTETETIRHGLDGEASAHLIHHILRCDTLFMPFSVLLLLLRSFIFRHSSTFSSGFASIVIAILNFCYACFSSRVVRLSEST
jgi:hypothetical protein